VPDSVAQWASSSSALRARNATSCKTLVDPHAADFAWGAVRVKARIGFNVLEHGQVPPNGEPPLVVLGLGAKGAIMSHIVDWKLVNEEMSVRLKFVAFQWFDLEMACERAVSHLRVDR
jgi:hypothetical protein